MTDNHAHSGGGLHIGIVPDGNRRFASAGGLPVGEGHRRGAAKLREFLRWCMEYPEIKRVSVFCLSEDNLKRPGRELDALWGVYEEEFAGISGDPFIRDNGIRVNIMGNEALWPSSIRALARQVISSTSHYSARVLNLLLAYSSRFELGRALAGPVRRLEDMLLVREPLNLLIRTGNQNRLSSFMLVQAEYAEIWFSGTMWPAFTRREFRRIMGWYGRQQKKFGE